MEKIQAMNTYVNERNFQVGETDAFKMFKFREFIPESEETAPNL